MKDVELSDAQRIDWIERRARYSDLGKPVRESEIEISYDCGYFHIVFGWSNEAVGPTLREALDSAILIQAEECIDDALELDALSSNGPDSDPNTPEAHTEGVKP